MALSLAFLILASLGDLALSLKTPLHYNGGLSNQWQKNSFIEVGGGFAILSSSYGLGVYSFIMFDFDPNRRINISEWSFFIFTLIGLCLTSAYFFLAGYIISFISDHTSFVTLVEVLL